MTNLTYRDGVSIGLIAIYTPLLIVAIILIFRHGLSRKSGWLFLVIFTLARILTGAFDLATINDRYNTTFLTGYVILQSIGLSPLLLVSLGLLSRTVDSINKSHHTSVTKVHLRIIQLVLLIGLIIGIVGGIDAVNAFNSTHVYTSGTKSKAGNVIFIVCYVLIVIAAIIISFSVSHADSGERRILMAVAAALPFLLVRLVYSAISVLAGVSSFSSVTGNVTILLIMGYVMELIPVLIYEAAGLSVPKIKPVFESIPLTSPDDSSASHHDINKPYAQPSQSTAVRLAKKTILGRIYMGLTANRAENAEMQWSTNGQQRR
jgi:hypothetical protein